MNDGRYEDMEQLFVMPFVLVGMIICKIIVAGSLVSALILSLLVNPVTKPGQMLEYLWSVPIIVFVVGLWWFACHTYFTSKFAND